MSKTISRNNNIDVLKVILSLFVVAAHVFPTAKVEGSKSYIFFFIHGLARTTVPIFLLITGYYLSIKYQDIKVIVKTAKKLLLLFLVWQILYFKIEYDFYAIHAITARQFYPDLYFGIGQLWYLVATALALFLLYASKSLSDIQRLLVAIILLAIAYLLQIKFEVSDTSSSFLTNLYYYTGTSRNFLFYAFPYLLIGVSHKLWMRYVQKMQWLLFVFTLLLAIESIYYMKLDASIFNIYLSALPFSIFVFGWVFNVKKQFSYTIPTTLSLGIYVIHFFIVLEVFKKYQSLTYLSYYIKFGIVLFVTVIVWYILDKINKKLPIFF